MSDVPACHTWPVATREELVAEWHQVHRAPPSDDDLLRLWQDGRCAVCAVPDWGSLVEDHDWDTGLTRGMLCRSCNVKEGNAGDVMPWTAFRENPPTRMLGMQIVYVNTFGGPTTRTQVPEADLRAAAGKLHIPYVQQGGYCDDESADG
ncbi:endonuclease domain-containing protein [Kribbella qitaiheensis]|uniref:endonuclease domain-containing protein n=1 Tax=Kribbella qitaiheensis TaxID=1544730 RepID=UPI003617459D